MLPVIIAVAVLFAAISAVAYLAVRTTLKAKKEDEEDVAPQRPGQAAAAARVVAPAGGRQAALDRMRQGMRQRLAQRQQAEEAEDPVAADDEEYVDESGSGSGSGSEDEGEVAPGNRRAARRRGGARDRAAAPGHQPSSKRRAYEDARAKRDAEREAQEAAQEEEMRRAAEERARREEEEAAKWLGQITVEAQGEDGDESGAAAEGLLAQFVEYIRARKTVPLEALALEFGVRTADAIDRIRALEAMGRLTGVMDDRGKYIYVSLEEMNAVASYIRSRGRVAISELAVRSASLIDLEPKVAEGAGGAGKGAAGTLDFDQLLAAA